MATKTPKIDIGKPSKVHPSVKRGTVNKLMNALRYFAEETRRLNMRDWGRFYTKEEIKLYLNYEDSTFPPCGTRGCLAGGILLTTAEGRKFLKKNNCIKTNATFCQVVFPEGTPKVAAKIIGLTEGAAKKLFYFKSWGLSRGWPEVFSTAYEIADDAQGKFDVLKARVFHFIETGK